MVPHHVRTVVDDAALAGARGFIVKSAGRMRALLADPAVNAARQEDFARVDRPMDCRRCNFRRLCYPRAAEVAPAAAEPAAVSLPA